MKQNKTYTSTHLLLMNIIHNYHRETDFSAHRHVWLLNNQTNIEAWGKSKSVAQRN